MASDAVKIEGDHVAQTAASTPAFDIRTLAAERMARQASRKRQRSISPPPPRQAPKLAETQVSLPSGARLNFFSTIVQQDQRARKSAAANAATANLKAATQPANVKPEPAQDGPFNPEILPPGTIKYPQGIVKKTWAFAYPRDGSDIKLEEVLEPLTLRTAVLSAFQWDTDWLLSKLKVPPNGGTTKCVFVMQAKEQALKDEMLRESEDMRAWLRLSFPPMEGQVHCMHSKLILLFHPEKLRLAVPTANLLDFDWGETGVMENSVFMIDLPRLHRGDTVKPDELTFFGKELLHFLEKQGLDQDIRDGVLNFDFAATEKMAFVHTIGGILYGDEAQRTGLPGLGRAVRHLGLTADSNLQIDFAASSIGSLNESFLRTVHAAATGNDIIARSANAVADTKATFFSPSKKKASPNKDVPRVGDVLRIYFPTHDTVKSSKAGAAGTICISRKWWEASTFPKDSFRDYVSTRAELLSHNKILYARGKATSEGGKMENDVAWVYVGSANVSESAWGKLVYDKREKAWKVNARNWECGVLIPVSQEKMRAVTTNADMAKVKKEVVDVEDSETASEDEGEGGRREIVGMDVFDDLVKPPWQIPGREYGGRRPWYFQERH